MKLHLSILLGTMVGALVLVANASPAAGTTTVNSFFPFSFVSSGCGEDILVSGTLHDLFHITIDSAGGINVKLHDQPQGATGVGLTSGVKYQATGVTQEEFSANGVGQFEDTFINNFLMISQGPAPNFVVTEHAHVTVNANGDVTATHDNFSIDCRG
jgi:hypothetical protein